MTSPQIIGILLAVTVLSAVFVAVNWLQERFNVDHRQRLFFLKLNLVTLWMVALAAFLILLLNGSAVISVLLPAGSTLQNTGISAQKLIFEKNNFSTAPIFIGFYLFGLTVMLVRLFISYLQMRKCLSQASTVEQSGRLVRSSDLIPSPLIFGIFVPQIFVPSRFLTEKSKEEIEVMLIHEETHLKNRDPQWILFSLLTRAFLFFTPAIFYLHRKFELEIEIACDQQTLTETHWTVQRYGNLLIDAVVSLQSSPLNPMSIYMSNTNLKRRIEAMKTKTLRKPLMAAIFGIFILGAGLTAIATTTGVSQSKELFKVKAEVLIGGKLVSSPQFIVGPKEPAVMELKSENPKTAFKMKLVASDFSSERMPDGIDLKMEVEYKTMRSQFNANPRVIVLPGQQGVVTIGSDNSETLEMRILAERQ